MDLPERIEICEVVLRDGLQNEKVSPDLAQRRKIHDLLFAAGIRRFEAGSMVNPKAVPQMALTDELCRLLPADQAEYRVLVLNRKGVERAIECGVAKAKLTVSVSETHQIKNTRMNHAEIFAKFADVAQLAAESRIELSGAMATAFGCPFEGRISEAQVISVVERYLAIGVRELSLSDTSGMANPRQVFELCTAMKKRFPEVIWNLHFHDTRGMGFANVLAGMQAGITRFDASLGGLGGCPFVPGATGNIATEDLVYMCDQMGVATGVSLDGLLAASDELENAVGHPLDSAIRFVMRRPAPPCAQQ